MGIDHVQIAAPRGSERAARDFYGGLLGLDEIEKPKPLRARGGAWFRAGAQQLHVGIEDPFAPARKAHPGFVAAELDELRARLVDAGCDVEDDETLAEARRFYVHDPFGNRLEIRQA